MSASGTRFPTLRRRTSRTLAEEAVEALAAPIRAGRLSPGDRMPTESEIMQQLGVSRTVVREAISRLQASGLVETRHGVGTFVAHTMADTLSLPPNALSTARDTVALLEVRIALEAEAAVLAAQRRSDEQLAAIKSALDALMALEALPDVTLQSSIEADYAFHRSIAAATGNAYFAQYLEHLGRDAIPRSRLFIGVPSNRRYLEKLNGEHRMIYDAIRLQDPDAAGAATRNHLRSSHLRLKRALESPDT